MDTPSTSATSTALSDGSSHYFHVAAVDHAGNASLTVHLGPFMIDTGPPSVTGLTDDATLRRSKTWTWAADETATFRSVIDQNSSWPSPTGEFTSTTTATKNNADGTWYLHVQAKDVAGNTGDVVTVSAVLDNTPPTATIPNPPPDPSNQSGATISISGSDVTYYKYRLDSGTYSSSEISTIIPINLSGLTNGLHTLYVIGRDTVGNWQSEDSATVIIWSVDAAPPEVPADLDLAAEDDSGASNTDNLTSNTTALSISGTGENGATVQLYDYDSIIPGASSLVSNGAFSMDIALTKGNHSITAVQTDATGNTSSASVALSITVDITIPDAPASLDLAAEDDSGISSTDDLTKITTGLSISGYGESNSVAQLFDNGISIDGATGAVSAGTFSIDISLAPGIHHVTAKQTDAAGSLSSASSPIVITVDDAVTSPTNLNLEPEDDTGSDNHDNVTRSNSSLTITGSGEESAVVQLYAGGTIIPQASGGVTGGAFSIDISLSEGTHAITAIQTDRAGNVSETSDALDMTIDNSRPDAPTALDLSGEDDSGISSTDNLTRNTSDLSISGSGNNGAAVQLYGNSILISGAATITANGIFSMDISLPNGIHSITAIQTDAAGNASTPSNALNLAIDTDNPDAPSNLDLASEDDTGASNTDNLTINTVGLSISGSGENNAAIQLYDGESPINGATATVAKGIFSIDISLAEGEHVLTAGQTDAAGNLSGYSSPLTITVDATSLAPSGLDLAADDDSGDSDTDNLTRNTSNLTITGSGEEGESVQLYDNDELIPGATATTNGGVFIIEISLPVDGTHAITAKQTDTAGSISTASTPLTITIDTLPPVVMITKPTNGSSVKPLDYIMGTSSDNAGSVSQLRMKVVNYLGEYIKYNTAITSYVWYPLENWITDIGTDTWVFSSGSSIWTEGQNYTITAQATDAAGNTTISEPTIFTYKFPDYEIVATDGPGGAVSPSGRIMLANGSNQSFTIAPDLGYIIADVLVNSVSQGPVTSYTFNTVSRNHTIAASFTYLGISTLTASAGSGGSISPAGEIGLTYGGNQTFTVTPDAGYHILEVKIDDQSAGQAAVHTFSQVNENHTISAAFERNTYSIQASVGGIGGTISPSGTSSVSHGESRAFVITPDAGYQLASVTVNGTTINLQTLEDATYTFENVTSDSQWIQATFSLSHPAAATILSMDFSSQTILLNETIDVSGKLTRLPDLGIDLSGVDVTLSITAPDETTWTDTATTYDSFGHYEFQAVSAFNQKGAYIFRSSFNGTGALYASQSDKKSLLVGSQAGYAIIVQGKIPRGEGLGSHNKTANRIYGKLIERGFTDLGIRYFNYDDRQPGVDAIPSKAGIQSAVENWARDMLNGSPASLYVILVDHGNRDTFYLGDEILTPADLNQWFNTLESTLTTSALAEKRVVIVGACFSGTFIPGLSKAGRIVITSSSSDEESYKGPKEPDGIRSGEFFMEELFQQLRRGYTLKDAFTEATDQTEIYTRRGSHSTNFKGPYFDKAMQHPLLDDNGDKTGSNVLSAGYGDGLVAEDIYLGIGLTYDTNSLENPADFVEVTETIYLGPSESSAQMWATGNDDSQIASAWIEIRPPSKVLSSTGGTGQLEIELFKELMSLNEATSRWEITYGAFDESGMYEVFYFSRDVETQAISPMKRSVVFKAKDGNSPPGVFSLVTPLQNAEQRTVAALDWQESVDPDGDPVTYNVLVGRDNNFDDIVYKKEWLHFPNDYIDDSAGLEDMMTYYWRIEAVDPFGARRFSSETRSFRTDNTNGLPGSVWGRLYDGLSNDPIGGASISSTLGSASTVSYPNGYYRMIIPSGTTTISSIHEAYETNEITAIAVKAGDESEVNVRMIPLSSSLDQDAPVSTASPAGGTYKPIVVTLSCDDVGESGCDEVYYTIDGNEPTAGSSPYAEPISIDAPTTLKYFAKDLSGNSESVNIEEYTIDSIVPTATVTYSITEPTNRNVIATLHPSETITLTNNGGLTTRTFIENGEFTFEFTDAVGNTGLAIAEVNNIDKTAPTYTITYDPDTLTNQDVTATITIDDGIVTSEGGNTHIFADNGSIIFEFTDSLGNTGSATATVNHIDKLAPTYTITYSPASLTNQDVVATIGLSDGTVTSEGGNTHTFAENGSFTFEFADSVGNTGSSVADVDWIDKTAPTATFTYSIIVPTNQDVVATLLVSEAVTVTNNGESSTRIFTENGEFTFEFIDAADNTGSAKATVSNIDKAAPSYQITYNPATLTNQDVVATITLSDGTVTSEGGNTHTFAENGSFTFAFTDNVGNTGTASGTVDWIDKTSPRATISYSIMAPTNQDVIATLNPSETVTVTNNGGLTTKTFTENSEFIFEFTDAAGNAGSATAKVENIDKTPSNYEITYNPATLTNQGVVAAITLDDGTVTSAGGNTHTFTANSSFTFTFTDSVGNTASAVATVNWIDKTAPTATFSYSNIDPTNQDVIVTLVPSETVTVTNNGGLTTRTFTENGLFIFEFADAAGNAGTAAVTVNNIDKTAPTYQIAYNPTALTNQEGV